MNPKPAILFMLVFFLVSCLPSQGGASPAPTPSPLPTGEGQGEGFPSPEPPPTVTFTPEPTFTPLPQLPPELQAWQDHFAGTASVEEVDGVNRLVDESGSIYPDITIDLKTGMGVFTIHFDVEGYKAKELTMLLSPTDIAVNPDGTIDLPGHTMVKDENGEWVVKEEFVEGKERVMTFAEMNEVILQEAERMKVNGKVPGKYRESDSDGDNIATMRSMINEYGIGRQNGEGHLIYNGIEWVVDLPESDDVYEVWYDDVIYEDYVKDGEVVETKEVETGMYVGTKVHLETEPDNPYAFVRVKTRDGRNPVFIVDDPSETYRYKGFIKNSPFRVRVEVD